MEKLPKCPLPLKIGVFSASSPISATVPSRYQRGKAFLQSKGIQVIDGNLCGKRDYYRSGTIRDRANELNQLLYREDIPILMAAIGGNNTNSILPYIDYDYLKHHPKVVIGYSDTTALLLAIYEKTGLPVFYGPALAASFGEFPPFAEETFRFFHEMILSPAKVPYAYGMPEQWTEEFIPWSEQNREKTGNSNDWICVRSGSASGRLMGGNLNTMEGIFGTPYMPEIREGDILLLEDALKDACTIERSFSMLKLAGIFDRVAGILLGKHEQFDDQGTGINPHEILLEVLGNTSVPILAQFDCCHTHPMFTMPLGCRIHLNAAAKKVTLLESPFL